MDQLRDLTCAPGPNESVFRADVKYAYYQLHLRRSLLVAFIIAGDIQATMCLNCGLPVAPWFTTRIMRPVLAALRDRGHQVLSYLDDFFGSAGPGAEAATVRGMREFEPEFRDIVRRMGLTLQADKCDFTGTNALDILGIMICDHRRHPALHVLTRPRKD